MAYPLEAKVQARTLYVEGGLTYDEVAEETGISLSQLKEWGKEGNWFTERATYERDFLSLHANVMKTKVKLAEAAVNSQDPQKIYALSRLIELDKGSVQQNRMGRSILAELLNFTATKHLDAFEQIGGLLLEFIEDANPDVLRLKSWQRKELREKIQASVGKVGGALATRKSLDPETLKKIREEVYGIVDASA